MRLNKARKELKMFESFDPLKNIQRKDKHGEVTALDNASIVKKPAIFINSFQMAKEEKYSEQETNRSKIIASLVKIKDVDTYSSEMLKLIKKDAENVDFFADQKDMESKDHKNAQFQSYVISQIRTVDLYSQGFYNCTGFIAVATDKDTGKQIAFMSHQNPEVFLKNRGDFRGPKFRDDIGTSLSELKNRAVDGTIDVVIVGGQQHESGRYKESEEKLQELCEKTLGVKATVMTGPKERTDHPTNVYFNTEHRRLYIVE